MPAQTLQTDGFVLLKRAPSDSFQSFTLFSAEHGSLLILQRIGKKATAGSVPLDLFDEVTLMLESSNQGQTWFVKEARLIARPVGIGRGYESLRFASVLSGLVARNQVEPESRERVATLLRTAFAAFAAGARPDVVYFKSLYVFARDEGYPLNQDWFPTLSAEDRAAVATLLNRPLAEQTATPALVTRLQAQLERYLSGHTDIIIP